jgi:alpha-glucosidase (family GH31 glycosyl hydrolase)
MTEHVLSDLANGVLTLTLNRPEKKNALTREMYQALGAAIDGAGANDDVRCVLIQAEGDIFTAGNDLGDFAAINRGGSGEPPSLDGARDRRLGNPLLIALARASTPIVAAVNGRAVGIGTTMLLHCDLVFVSEDAILTTPFVAAATVALYAPFYVSSAGYGLYVATTAPGSYDIGDSDPDTLRFRFEAVRPVEDRALRYSLFVGSPADVLDEYTRPTGRPSRCAVKYGRFATEAG